AFDEHFYSPGCKRAILQYARRLYCVCAGLLSAATIASLGGIIGAEPGACPIPPLLCHFRSRPVWIIRGIPAFQGTTVTMAGLACLGCRRLKRITARTFGHILGWLSSHMFMATSF